jgi:hypothetical protein
MSELQWPTDPKFLIPGVNDTWNDYQKFRKGAVVTSKDWKDARKELNAQFQQYLSEGGLPARIEKETHRFDRMIISINWFTRLHAPTFISFCIFQEGGILNLQPSNGDL